MEKHLLSFVTDENGGQVVIHVDLAGVEFFIEELNRIKEKLEENDCPHTHLFTEERGGSELSNSKIVDQKDERNQVHHVKIYGWNEEWRRKNRLKRV